MCVCEQTIASLMATIAARTKVVSIHDCSCDCVSDFQMETVSAETLMIVGLVCVEMAPVSTR